jgi:flagellar hook assembly protein FlgD
MACQKRTVVNTRERYENGNIKIVKKEITTRRPTANNDVIGIRIKYKEYHENGKRKSYEKSRDYSKVWPIKEERPDKKVMIKKYNERGKLVYKFVKTKKGEEVHRYDDRGRLTHIQLINKGRVRKVIDVNKQKVVKRN